MNNVWNYISNIGVKVEYNVDFQKRLILQNRTTVLACIVYLVMGIIYFVFNDLKTAIFIESLIFINILSFCLQRKHFHKFSLSFFLISSYLSIFYFDSYAGLKSGAFLYYVPVIMSLFFLFDIKKDKTVIALHILLIIVLFFIHQMTERTLFQSDIVTDVMRSRLYIANITLSLISLLYFIFLGIKNKI